MSVSNHNLNPFGFFYVYRKGPITFYKSDSKMCNESNFDLE